MLVRRLSLSLLSSSSLLLLCLISSYLLDRVSAVTADEPGHRDLIVSVRSSRREIGKKNQCFEKVGRRRKKVKKVAESRHFLFFFPRCSDRKREEKATRISLFSRPKEGKPKRKSQANTAMVLLPNVKWAQRKDKLFLTIDIQVWKATTAKSFPLLSPIPLWLPPSLAMPLRNKKEEAFSVRYLALQRIRLN